MDTRHSKCRSAISTDGTAFDELLVVCLQALETVSFSTNQELPAVSCPNLSGNCLTANARTSSLSTAFHHVASKAGRSPLARCGAAPDPVDRRRVAATATRHAAILLSYTEVYGMVGHEIALPEGETISA